MLNFHLKSFIIENFRSFKGTHVINFFDLNIYTGANNSGKSTVFNALKLFSEGLKKSDFPALELASGQNNLGTFDQVINKDCGKEEFKLGYFIHLGKIEQPFKVLYSFIDGKDTDSYYDGTAIFKRVEIFDNDDKLLFAIYDTWKLEVNDDNCEYDFDPEYINEIGGYIGLCQLPFKSPSENYGQGTLIFKLNLDLLTKYIQDITSYDFSNTLDYLYSIKGKFNNWWGECFDEAACDEINHRFTVFNIEDFFRELFFDTYYNFCDYSLKKLISGPDNEIHFTQYNSIKRKYDYDKFLNFVIGPILDTIRVGNSYFKKNNIFQINTSEYKFDRLNLKSDSNEYLKILFKNDEDEATEFIANSLKTFGISGNIEIFKHLNSAYELNLIISQSGNKSDDSKVQIPIQEKINVKDLGKGTQGLIYLILHFAHVLKINLLNEGKENLTSNNLDRRPDPMKDLEYIHQHYLVTNEFPHMPEWEYNNRILLLVEEPEQNLHPDWQSKLADLFVLFVNSVKNSFLIIETHSTFIIQRLQYLVAYGKIETEKINIQYFNKSEIPERFYKINLRNDGIIENRFGEGFYDETARLTASILKLSKVN